MRLRYLLAFAGLCLTFYRHYADLSAMTDPEADQGAYFDPYGDLYAEEEWEEGAVANPIGELDTIDEFTQRMMLTTIAGGAVAAWIALRK